MAFLIPQKGRLLDPIRLLLPFYLAIRGNV